MSRAAVPLDTLLDRWVARSLITPEQADAIRADDPRVEVPTLETRSVPSDSSRPELPSAHQLVVEALGYLGGVVVLIAAALVTVQFWSDVSTTTRIVVGALATAMLAGGGLALRWDGAPAAVRRVVAVLLALAVAGTAATLGLFGDEVLHWQARAVATLFLAGAAVVAAWLWWRRPSFVQQVATVVPLVALTAVQAGRLDGHGTLPGLVVWGAGLVWALLGWGGVLRPRGAVVPFGALAMLLGAVMTLPEDAGIALGLATLVLFVAVAVTVRDLVLLAVAAVGAFMILPTAVTTWFPGSLAAPIALLVIGSLLVGAAIVVARGRAARADTEPRSWGRDDRRVALVGVPVVVVAVGATVVAIGTGLV